MTLHGTLDHAVADQPAKPRHHATSQVGRILKHFKKHGRVTNIELVRDFRILRGSERMRELKAEGYLIRSVKLSSTVWAYIYEGHADEVAR